MKAKELFPTICGFICMFILSAGLDINFFLSMILSFLAYQKIKSTMIKRDQKKKMLDEYKRIDEMKKKELEEIESFKQMFKNSDELALMNKAYEDLSTINKVYKQTEDLEVKSLLKDVFQTSYSIFNHLKDNPNKINRSRKFFDHHLETASKVSKTYQMFLDKNISDTKKLEARDNTIKALKSLDVILKNFLESLFQNEFLDIESDIKVLESLKKEKL